MAEEVSDISNIRSFAGIDGGLILENTEGYYWKDSSGVLTTLHVPDDVNRDSFTLIDGYGIDTITGAVYQPIITNHDSLAWLKVVDENDDLVELLGRCLDIAVIDNSIYISAFSEDDLIVDIYQYSIVDRFVERVSDNNIHAITSYQNSQLMVAGFDTQNRGYTFYLWDPKTLTETLWGEMDGPHSLSKVWGLTYSASENVAYFVLEDRVYRLEQGQSPEIIGYLSDNPSMVNAAVLGDGTYCINVKGRLQAFSIEGFSKRRMLTIAGEFLSSDMNPSFSKLYPEIDVRMLSDDTFSADQVLLDLTTHQAQADIFTLNVSSGIYSAIQEKGFCFDLSQSKILHDFTLELYPEIYKWVVSDGSITAFPVELHTDSLLAINELVMAELGLDKPATFQDLITLYAQWDDISSIHADAYTLSTWQPIAHSHRMIADFTNLYISSIPEGEPRDFEAKAYIDTLAYLDEKSMLFPTQRSENETEYSEEDFESFTLLITSYPLLNTDSCGSESNFIAMPLAIDKNHTAVIPASLKVLAVNAASPNIDIAIKYLECLANNYPAESSIMFLNKPAVPIENAVYAENKQTYSQMKEDLLVLLENAKPEEEASLKSKLDEVEFALWETEMLRWYISQEDIERYQAIAPLIRILPDDGFKFYLTLPNMQLLVHEYVNEEITATEFARRFNAIQKMINAERK